MNNLAKTIAGIPFILTGILTIAHANEFITINSTLLSILYSTFFFMLLSIFIRAIFYGTYVSNDSQLKETGVENKGAMIRVSIGMVQLMFFFGLIFLFSMADDIQTMMMSTVSGIALAWLSYLYEERIMNSLNIQRERAYKGISIKEVRHYFVWYHYLMFALLIFFLFAIASSFD